MSKKSSPEKPRRQFIKSMSIVAVALPAISLVTAFPGRRAPFSPAKPQDECEWCGAADAPANPSAKTVIAPPSESGQPLVISGTVYQEDGRTPAEGVLIYAYHTNATGIYPKRTPDSGRPQWRHGYLRGWIRTGVDGSYEFRTIRPAAYPGRTEPAHIHLTISAANYPEYSGTFWFADDPLITPEVLARNNKVVSTRSMRAAVILTLRRNGSGVLHGAHNIRLERVKN